MKWNASLAAALSLLLAACGGGRGYDYAPEPAGPPPGSVAAQSWGDPPGPLRAPGDRGSETWRAADGTIRTRAPAPEERAPQLSVESEVREQSDEAPGTSYAAPDAPAYSSAPPGQPRRSPPERQRSYAPPAPQDDPSAGMEGPRGSSQPSVGERRYDEIGYAGIRGVAGDNDGAVVAVHRSLPTGTVVEVTALDTGRTILVLVTGAMTSGEGAIDLSPGAARELGYPGTGPIAVRVRKVVAGPQDLALLRQGQPAAQRPDTPPVLLNALRKRLPTAVAAASQPVRARPPVTPGPVRSRYVPAPSPRAPAPRGGFAVQVAALSNARNAQSLAERMGGFVKQGGGLHRVQLGPFATRAEAERARAGAVRAGHGDARVIAAN